MWSVDDQSTPDQTGPTPAYKRKVPPADTSARKTPHASGTRTQYLN